MLRHRRAGRNRQRGKDRARQCRALDIDFELIGVEADDPPLRDAPGFVGLIAFDHRLARHAAEVAFERPRRLDKIPAVDAEADDLLAGQHMHVFELDGARQFEQADVGAHLDDVAGKHPVGAFDAAHRRRRAHFRARGAAAEMHHHLWGMHRQQRVRRNLAGGRPQHEVWACRVAGRAAGPEIAAQFAPGLFELEAGLAILGLETAVLHHRARHPRHRTALPQHRTHRQRMVQIAARRMKIERQIAVAETREKLLEPRRGAGVYLPFDRDPAIAAAAASVRRTLDDVKRHRRRRRLGQRRPRRRDGRRRRSAGKDEDCEKNRAPVHGSRSS